MKKLNLTFVILMGLLFVSTPWVAASEHYVIIAPLTDKEPKIPGEVDLKKNSAAFEVSAPAHGNVTYFLAIFPITWFEVPMNDFHFVSSEYEVPNLFSITGAEPRLVWASHSGGVSRAMLRVSGPKNELVLSVPPVEQSLGIAFSFPLGHPGEKASLLIGNPHPTDVDIVVKYGPTTSPVSQRETVSSKGVVIVPLIEFDTNVMIASNAPVFIMLEIIDNGIITRTFIQPG